MRPEVLQDWFHIIFLKLGLLHAAEHRCVLIDVRHVQEFLHFAE